MHTFTGNTCKIHYNSDMSGELIIASGNAEMTIDAQDILNFIAEYVRSQKIRGLEQMSSIEVLLGEIPDGQTITPYLTYSKDTQGNITYPDVIGYFLTDEIIYQGDKQYRREVPIIQIGDGKHSFNINDYKDDDIVPVFGSDEEWHQVEKKDLVLTNNTETKKRG